MSNRVTCTEYPPHEAANSLSLAPPTSHSIFFFGLHSLKCRSNAPQCFCEVVRQLHRGTIFLPGRKWQCAQQRAELPPRTVLAQRREQQVSLALSRAQFHERLSPLLLRRTCMRFATTPLVLSPPPFALLLYWPTRRSCSDFRFDTCAFRALFSSLILSRCWIFCLWFWCPMSLVSSASLTSYRFWSSASALSKLNFASTADASPRFVLPPPSLPPLLAAHDAGACRSTAASHELRSRPWPQPPLLY